MAKNKHKGIRHLPQRRGRALKGGDRYPSGKLKVATPKDDGAPNERIIAARRAMMETPNAKVVELRAAENPLDLAKHLGWITPTEHRAGEMLAAIYGRAGLELPSLRVQDLAKEIRGGQAGTGDAKAMSELRRCAAALQGWPKPTGAVIDLCVLGNWPVWMLARVAKVGPPEAKHEVGRTHLRTGLRIVGGVLGCGEVATGQRRAG